MGNIKKKTYAMGSVSMSINLQLSIKTVSAQPSK